MQKIADFMRSVKVQAFSRDDYIQYWITIPKDLVEKYGLKKGTELIVLDDNGVIKLIPKEKIRIEIA